MVFASFVGICSAFLFGLFDPRVLNKAGPDWLWAGGRDDVVRNLYFRHDGRFRRYGRAALLATFSAGTATVVWFL